MTDETEDQGQPESTDSGASKGTLGAVRQTLGKRDSKGRPVAVYGILGLGVATLLALMLVVYLWSSDRDKPDQVICTSITPERAQFAVRDGQVERITIAYDGEVELPTDSSWGPVLARLDYTDGQCGNLPQGIANQSDVLAIVGAITFYNTTTDSAQVEIIYNPMSELDGFLFDTPTEVPTEIPPPTETVIATETPALSPEASPTEAPATPAASPATTPRAGTPEVTPTRTPSPTPTP